MALLHGWGPGRRGYIIRRTRWEICLKESPVPHRSTRMPHFLVRMVHKFSNQVTIYVGGPMTNLALAISIDPEFPKLVKELVFMGASLNPETTDPELINTPRREFNLWFDPEAAHIVL